MKIPLPLLLCALFSIVGALPSVTQAEPAAEKHAAPIIQADTEFARLAETSGLEKAFDAYFAAGAISPMIGDDKITDRAGIIQRMKGLDAIGVKLSWKPSGGDLAASGDLGYTYGKWELNKKEGGEPVTHGFYTTIWKKGADGNWKAEFDIGNEATEGR